MTNLLVTQDGAKKCLGSTSDGANSIRKDSEVQPQAGLAGSRLTTTPT